MLGSESIPRTMNPKVGRVSSRVQRDYRFGNSRRVWFDRGCIIVRLVDERIRTHPVPAVSLADFQMGLIESLADSDQNPLYVRSSMERLVMGRGG